jgi:hypothetical protein
MELDNLKQAWKEQDIGEKMVSDEQILSMLQKKSQRPIAKMKRNLFWELVAVIVIYSATIAYYFIEKGGRYWEIAVLLLLVGLLFVVYYYRKNKLLKQMECVACEVKSNLQQQVSVLEKYVRFYFIAGTVLTPIAYMAAGLLVFHKSPGVKMNSDFLTVFIGSGLVLAILVYFMNIWYVNKLYGQHVKKLKDLLRQMEEIPENKNTLNGYQS